MAHRDDQKEKQIKDMKETLERFVGGDHTTDRPGDGYAILRWARRGMISIKMENDDAV